MANFTRLSRIAAFGLPLAFVVISWVVAAGFPYYLDSNETFLSYLHARNLEIWSPWEYSWLTAEATDPQRTTTANVYTHNPNGPRYVHYLLLRLGVRDLSLHVLIISLVATALTMTLLWRLFGHPGVAVVPLALAMDFAGFLAWTVNTYRVWTYVLFFGLALAVARRRLLWVGVLTFALFQVEYAMALFMGVTMTLLAVLLHGWRARWLVASSAAGGVASVVVFAVQVLTYYGWAGFVAEIAETYARRGPAEATGGLERFGFQAWHGLLLLFQTMALETYNRYVVIVIIAGITIAAVKLLRGRYDGPRRLLAGLLLTTTAGMMVTSALLYGYFVEGYVVSLLPCGVFLVTLATGVVAVEIYDLTAHLSSSKALASYASLASLVPIVMASLAVFSPPSAVDFFTTMRTTYRDQPIVAPNLGPWLAGPELAFTLTGGRSARTGSIEATREDVQRLSALRDADGMLTYACLDTLYIRKMAKLGESSVCEVAAGRMLRRGHQVVAEGFGWVVIRIYPEDRPAQAQGIDITPEQAARWGERRLAHAP